MSFDTQFRKWFIRWYYPRNNRLLNDYYEGRTWLIGPIAVGWRRLPVRYCGTTLRAPEIISGEECE